MNDDDFPKVFRKEQIERFVDKMKQANAITTTEGNVIHDEYIDLIIEEVQENEADLTSARVAIEKYILTRTMKNHDDKIIATIAHNAREAINEVKQLEIKIFGGLRYAVGVEDGQVKTFRIDGAQSYEIPVPQKLIDQQADMSAWQTTPFYGEQELKEDIENQLKENLKQKELDELRACFDPLQITEDPESVEKAWLDSFIEKKNEHGLCDFITDCVYKASSYDQINYTIVEKLLAYTQDGMFNGKKLRDSTFIWFEENLNIPDFEDESSEIHNARQASLRCLFTALFLSSTDEFMNSLKDQIEDEYREKMFDIEFDNLVGKKYKDCCQTLIYMYAKYPIFEHNVKDIKYILHYLHQDIRKNFYGALDQFRSYYDERNFLNSAEICGKLMNFIQDTYLQNEVQEAKMMDPKHIEEIIVGNMEIQSTNVSDDIIIID